MDIGITFERPEFSPRSGPVTVGWFLNNDRSSVLMFPPERVSFRGTNKTHAKSAARCPSVVQLESRYFLIRCPYDIHIGFRRDDAGQPKLVNRAGPRGAVRADKLGKIVHLTQESECTRSPASDARSCPACPHAPLRAAPPGSPAWAVPHHRV